MANDLPTLIGLLVLDAVQMDLHQVDGILVQHVQVLDIVGQVGHGQADGCHAFVADDGLLQLDVGDGQGQLVGNGSRKRRILLCDLFKQISRIHIQDANDFFRGDNRNADNRVQMVNLDAFRIL